MATDEFGGVAIEPERDEFGGVRVAPARAPWSIPDGEGNVSESIPEAFLDRVRAGQALSRILSAAGHEAKEGIAGQTPTGFHDDTLSMLVDKGIFHDPLKSRGGPIQMANEAVMIPAAQLWQTVTGTLAAGIHGAGGAVGQLVEEFGGSQGTANRAKNETINAANWALIEGGMGRFSRPAVEPHGVTDQVVGGLPRPEDFTNAAKVLDPTSPPAGPKLRLAEAPEGGVYEPEQLKPNEKYFKAFRPDGEVAAEIMVKFDGKTATIEDILAPGKPREQGQNTLGPSELRSVLRQFQEAYPEIETLTGKRVSGARMDGGYSLLTEPAQVEVNLRRMWQEDGITPAEAVHDAQRDAFLKHEITARQINLNGATTFKTAKGSEYEVHEDGTTTRNKAARAEHPGDSGIKDRSAKTVYFDEQSIRAFDIPDGARWRVIDHGDGTMSLATWNEQANNWGISPGSRNIPYSEQPAIGLNPLEVWKPESLKGLTAYRGVHPGNVITEMGKREGALSAADIEVLTETGGRPGSLGAAATEPGDIPLTIQPASPPGSLAASFKSAADTLFDIGRDAQMLVAPMARGTRDSMAIAKDFANSLRRNRWDWSRIDTDIAKRFTPEQRARMWNAADEESVSLQLGEAPHLREHQGLITLEPAERAAVDELQARAQNAWLRAQDIGMVEGEGLPSYTPRMVMNVGTAFADDKALPLNVIGNNLKIRTAQMLRRKHMTVEETERAAKDYVAMKEVLKLKSADEIQAAIDKVAVVRDIRTLPLATAKLEDAIAGRSLINNIKDYGKSTGADTVVEGAIPAGSETKWFTLDHPAFRTWRPQLKEIDGRVQAVKDAEGNVIFEQVPIYVHGDFEGPLRAVLSHKSGALYGGMMSLKGKTMSLIMNSPMIHNMVEFGRAFPAMPVRIFKAYFDGNRAKNDPAIMGEAIDNGLVPIGHRFFNQDISGLMESPDLTPGRSWTAKLLAAVPGLFDEAAGVAVKRSIDKAGDFWHNTLLWDRIGDLQMGLYTNLRADMIAKGMDQQTASRIAAHWANRYAGALPKEAMSDAATKWANFAFFSRSFTIGNLGVLKDAFTGLPKDVLAQIERDAGVVDPKALGYSKDVARRKAFSIVMMDIALLHVANSVLQSALNIMLMDSSIGEELHGYTRRYRDMVNETATHPLSLVTPLSIAGAAMGAAVGGVGGAALGGALGTGLGVMRRLSATADNEHGKQDRLKIGYGADGTAIYARSPFGKIGEEFTGYLESPIDMLKKKEGTIARPMLQVISNDKGFGRKIYDPDAETPAERSFAMWKIIEHIGKSQFPEGQIGAFADLVKGEGDKKINTLQLVGPLAGVTFSRGAPGGPAVGEMYQSKSRHDFAVNQALPDIRRQIQRGDIAGAQDRMTGLDIPPALQRWYVKTTLDPALRLSPRATRDFYLHSTPEQRARFERAQQTPPPP